MDTQSPPARLLAVDIGNSRIKLGRFDAPWEGDLPRIQTTRTVEPLALDSLRGWPELTDPRPLQWRIASVNRPSLAALLDWIERHRRQDRVTVLGAGDVGVEVRGPDASRVGIDRLLDAHAAGMFRPTGHGAVVVDLGSAITVDLVAVDGALLGGAILAGAGMSARALHEFTDLLPLVDTSIGPTESEAAVGEPAWRFPEPLGQATAEALRAGLFWGTVGAIRELYTRLSARLDAPCELLLTGGPAGATAQAVGSPARWVPHLTLVGIALASHRI